MSFTSWDYKTVTESIRYDGLGILAVGLPVVQTIHVVEYHSGGHTIKQLIFASGTLDAERGATAACGLGVGIVEDESLEVQPAREFEGRAR